MENKPTNDYNIQLDSLTITPKEEKDINNNKTKEEDIKIINNENEILKEITNKKNNKNKKNNIELSFLEDNNNNLKNKKNSSPSFLLESKNFDEEVFLLENSSNFFDDEEFENFNIKNKKNTNISNLNLDVQKKIDSLLENHSSLLKFTTKSIETYETHLKNVKSKYKTLITNYKHTYLDQLKTKYLLDEQNFKEKFKSLEVKYEQLESVKKRLEVEIKCLKSDNFLFISYKDGYEKLKKMYRELREKKY